MGLNCPGWVVPCLSMGRILSAFLNFVCTCYDLQKCSPSMLAKHQRLNNVLAVYFCKHYMQLAASCSVLIIRLAASLKQISYSRPPASCKLHPFATMKYKIPKFINILHATGTEPNEICIWLATNWMQIQPPPWGKMRQLAGLLSVSIYHSVDRRQGAKKINGQHIVKLLVRARQDEIF